MASSGSTSVRVTDWDTLRFRWWVNANDQSVENNRTTVRWALELISTDNGRIVASFAQKWSVTVDGTSYSGTASIAIGNNETRTLASGTTAVVHNSDGTKTFSYSFSQYFGITFSGVWIDGKSGSGSGTLDTISRASQPSCVTWPEHTQNVGNFGDTISIHMNRKAANFTHTVRFQFGTYSGVIDRDVTTGTTWTIPLYFMDLLPNATKGSGTIYVDTYNGSTLVGTKYCGFTATVPSSVKPTVTMTLEDTTGIDDIYGAPVQGLSRIKVTLKETLAYSSPIASRNISINGAKYTASPATSGVLQDSGTSPVTVSITDGRGRTGSASYNMNVLAYSAPNVSSLTVHRCDADGTNNDQGLYVRVIFSAAISSMGGKNTAAYKLRYKQSTASTYTEVALPALNNVFSVPSQEYIFAANDSSSYDVEVTATDRHSTGARATSASTAFSLMDWHPSGTGVRWGGVSEQENTFQNDLELLQTANRYAFSSPGVAGSPGFILMAQIDITAANADTPITFILSRRQATTDMKVSIRFNNPTDTASTLSSIRYEGSNYGAFLVQASAMSWALYVQKGSSYDTITIQDWYTSHTMTSRIRVTFPGILVDTVPTPFHRATPVPLQSILDCFMPVGYILMLYSHADPNTMYPGTTWVRITNRFLWAVDANGTIGLTSGEKEVTLTPEQMPAHSHGAVYTNLTGDAKYAWYTTGGTNLGFNAIVAGEDQPHNNMPPYIQVSIWRRTA